VEKELVINTLSERAGGKCGAYIAGYIQQPSKCDKQLDKYNMTDNAITIHVSTTDETRTKND
jgi:hypothetical protein